MMTNTVLVVATTLFFSLVVFGSIAFIAETQADNVPAPVMTGVEYGSDPYGMAPGSASGATMRVCPATGCAAATCHAETGEPIPH